MCSEKRAKNGGKRNLYKRHEYTPPPEGEEEDMGREIPKSFATMSEADKILFEWWEVEKKSWAAIARKVNELTGGHETGADMALRYEALRRYLHHKERYFVVCYSPIWPWDPNPQLDFHEKTSDHSANGFVCPGRVCLAFLPGSGREDVLEIRRESIRTTVRDPALEFDS